MSEETTLSIDLDDLQDIMDDLEPSSGERRKNNLTKDDVLIIARIIQAVSGRSCSLGFDENEVNIIKKVVKVLDRGAMAVGWLVVSAIVSGILALVVLGAKHGIHEIATKGVK
ncbi:hypothetical protein FY034_07230 [Trichlorobacter lovleyi]|uniref:hypothetical protein n=1 Tax=Trichlorobacter lovleyi TaxID=313985 RepID=UPI002240A718|nr:hypothetical protein [Trichlorobacter lovleyi]QOX78728.1 hypothetical protein FY034_07230 [Trichlorobacter lovleyi]